MEIDFDAASAAWRANKRHVGFGVFVYRCAYVHTSGKLCGKTVEAQQRPATYSVRPDWVTDMAASRQTHNHPQPHLFCVRHRRRGPASFIVTTDDGH